MRNRRNGLPRAGEALDWERIILGLRKTTKEFIENVLENIIESIVVTTLGGRIVFFNKFSEEMFGYRADEVLNQPITILGARSPDVLGHIRANTPFRGEIELRTKAGRGFPAYVRCVPLRDDGDRPIAMVGLASDLTQEKEKKRIDEELEKLEERLFQSEKMAVLGTLSSEIAHEINNPLGGLIMAVQMLQQDVQAGGGRVDLDATLRELQGIEADARRCKRITQRLLDFSRAIPDERAPLDVNRVVEESLLLVERQTTLHNIVFTKHYGIGIPPVRGDANSLQQVIINLVRNARDAMPAGGAIEIRTALVVDEGGREWLSVGLADSGPGVPEEIAPRLFDPFFTTKSPGEGTGLGLAVSKRIVEQHGGRITLANRSEGGAEFVLLLPADRSETGSARG